MFRFKIILTRTAERLTLAMLGKTLAYSAARSRLSSAAFLNIPPIHSTNTCCQTSTAFRQKNRSFRNSNACCHRQALSNSDTKHFPPKFSYMNKASNAAAHCSLFSYVSFLFSVAHKHLTKYTSLPSSTIELETYTVYIQVAAACLEKTQIKIA